MTKCETKCKIKCFNEYIATIILALVIGVAVSVFWLYAHHRAERVSEQIKVVCVIQTDSTGVVSQDAQELAESVKHVIEAHEHALKDKYEYILDQKENIQDYLTWGGIIVTIVLSIFGFFGYKSLNSIEDRLASNIQNVVLQKASRDAIAYAREKIEEYERTSTTNLEDGVNNKIDAKFFKSRTEINKDVQEIAKRTTKEEYDRTIAIKESDIIENSKKIDDLQKDVAILRNMIDDISLRNKQIEARLSGYKPKVVKDNSAKEESESQTTSRKD